MDTILLGRKTYELFVDYWPTASTDEEVIADRLNELPKLVFSSTLSGKPSWANTTFVSAPVETEVARLKAEGGDPLRVIGSLSLTASLFAAGLVDRVTVVVFPLILGETGEQPMLRGLPDVGLELLGTHVLDDRLVVMEYRPER